MENGERLDVFYNRHLEKVEIGNLASLPSTEMDFLKYLLN